MLKLDNYAKPFSFICIWSLIFSSSFNNNYDINFFPQLKIKGKNLSEDQPLEKWFKLDQTKRGEIHLELSYRPLAADEEIQEMLEEGNQWILR